MKQEKRGKSRFLEPAGAYQEAVMGEPRIIALGSRGVFIENYRRILFYSDTCLRIQTRQRTVCIAGKQLSIRYYDRDEMRITGRVEVIRFE